MLTKNLLVPLSLVFATLLTGTLTDSHRVKIQASPSPSVVANLPNGNYQFCSQPDPNNWQDGAGICFNFKKTGNQVDGYYGYPHSDSFICVKGKVNGNLITGEALEILWADEQPMSRPEPEFQWDSEGHLIVGKGNTIRRSNSEAGYMNWVLFRNASLNVSGFYRYSTPRMKPPSELCQWNSP